MHCQISTWWVALLLIIYTERFKRVSHQIIFASTSDSGSAVRKRGSCRLLRLLCLPEYKFPAVAREIGCATGCNCVKQDQRRVRSQVVEREMNGNWHSHQPLHEISLFSWTLQCIGLLKSIWIYSICSSRQLLSVIVYFRRDLQVETVFQVHFNFFWSQLFFVAASKVFPAECVQESMEGGSCQSWTTSFWASTLTKWNWYSVTIAIYISTLAAAQIRSTTTNITYSQSLSKGSITFVNLSISPPSSSSPQSPFPINKGNPYQNHPHATSCEAR